MKFINGYYTDVGIKKAINEDSLLISSAATSKGNIFMALVCDGMGGLSSGELASATVIKRFSDWFANDLKEFLKRKDFKITNLKDPINRLLRNLNQDILLYGQNKKINLGTTATGILVFNNKYLIFHVGDTRIYCLNRTMIQLTEDQTWVNNEIQKNRMTIEQAKTDPRRNVLLQCIGASKTVSPVFLDGNIYNDEVYLLCSDGFRHEVEDFEIFENLNPTKQVLSSDLLTSKLKELVELNKVRNETDNITAVAFQCREEEYSWQK